MQYRTILVHVDVTSEGRARLENAVCLADKLGAKLLGLGAAGFDPIPDHTGNSDAILQQISLSLQQAQRIFREATAELRAAEWRALVRRPASALADLACGADLVFGSRTGEFGPPNLFARPDTLLLAAGTPILLQPPAAPPLDATRIVLGWKNTREARRAVWDALPLLKVASEVKVLRFVAEVDPRADDGLEEVGDRLRGHGVSVTVARRERAANSVGEDLIDAAIEAGADLIVAGAYGHPRLRELIFGGVTRSLLSQSPKYVLFSH